MRNGKLVDKYTAPPFTVLNSRMGYWAKRKEYWRNEKKCNAVLGRNEFVLTGSPRRVDYMRPVSGKHTIVVEVSVFDPVLAEISYKWFCPAGGKILDPFAGGAVRGIVAETLGFDYTGIDLSEKQIHGNIENCQIVGVSPKYICDDSLNLHAHFDDETFDFVFSCPPYFDLEKYSDDARDLSNMSYNEFLQAYQKIIFDACKKLKQNRFACFVVGDIRDKKGFYRDFIGDTKKAFFDAGLKLYNDMVFIENPASAALRCQRIFEGGRKVVKTHQNVLVFYKGDPKQIKSVFTESEERAA